MTESQELALENRQSESSRRRKTFLDRVSRTLFVQGWYAFVLSFFVFFVLVPTLFVLSFLFTGWGDLQAFVFRNANVMAQILSAIGLSFSVALTVTAVDLLFGLLLDWLIVLCLFPGTNVINKIYEF